MISIKRYLDSDSPVPGPDADGIELDSFAAALDVYGSSLMRWASQVRACPGLASVEVSLLGD